MAFRAFIAVPVEPLPGLVHLIEGLAALRADLKVVQPTNLHFTLSFLGDVPDDARAPLSEAIHEAVKGLRGFDAELKGVGAFPNVRHPRVIWVGVEDPRPLVDLALRMRAALARQGFAPDDKDFRAHLTLARVKSERRVDEAVQFLRHHGHNAPGPTRVSEVSLYRSILGPQGPQYEALETARLEA